MYVVHTVEETKMEITHGNVLLLIKLAKENIYIPIITLIPFCWHILHIICVRKFSKRLSKCTAFTDLFKVADYVDYGFEVLTLYRIPSFVN